MNDSQLRVFTMAVGGTVERRIFPQTTSSDLERDFPARISLLMKPEGILSLNYHDETRFSLLILENGSVDLENAALQWELTVFTFENVPMEKALDLVVQIVRTIQRSKTRPIRSPFVPNLGGAPAIAPAPNRGGSGNDLPAEPLSIEFPTKNNTPVLTRRR